MSLYCKARSGCKASRKGSKSLRQTSSLPTPSKQHRSPCKWQLSPGFPSKPFSRKRGRRKHRRSSSREKAAGRRSSRLRKLGDGEVPTEHMQGRRKPGGFGEGELSWAAGTGFWMGLSRAKEEAGGGSAAKGPGGARRGEGGRV